MSQISHRQRLRDAGRLKVNREIDLSFRPGSISRVTIPQQQEFATRHLQAPQETPTPFVGELPLPPPPPPVEPTPPPPPPIEPTPPPPVEPPPVEAPPVEPPPVEAPPVEPPPVEAPPLPPVEPTPPPPQEPPADVFVDEPPKTDGTEEM